MYNLKHFISFFHAIDFLSINGNMEGFEYSNYIRICNRYVRGQEYFPHRVYISSGTDNFFIPYKYINGTMLIYDTLLVVIIIYDNNRFVYDYNNNDNNDSSLSLRLAKYGKKRSDFMDLCTYDESYICDLTVNSILANSDTMSNFSHDTEIGLM